MYVTTLAAAARTGVFLGTIKSTVFLNLPTCTEEECLSILCNLSKGTGMESVSMDAN